jgi:hypothetical protein
MIATYRLWACRNCGAFFMVGFFYPDKSYVDEWDGSELGFESASRTVTCCIRPDLDWVNHCFLPDARIPSRSFNDFIPDDIELDGNMGEIVPELIDKRVDRFEVITRRKC